MRFGFHVSVAEGIHLAVDRALERRCRTFQVFSSSPRTWRTRQVRSAEAAAFRAKVEQSQLAPVVFHAPYLVNLGSGDSTIYEKSLAVMKHGARLADELGVRLFGFHVGNFRTSERERALDRVAGAVTEILRESEEVVVLLENSSGGGTSLGSTYEELATVLNRIEPASRAGVCFDTAHAFAAGYDLRTAAALEKTLMEFDKIVGLHRLMLIHANDSKYDLGTNRDRHEDIGQGFIGIEGFQAIVNHRRLKELPCILETPGLLEDDSKNLEVIEGLVAD
ncbi:MAG: deoxyribonuclease IV [Terriglobia bacterium]